MGIRPMASLVGTRMMSLFPIAADPDLLGAEVLERGCFALHWPLETV
jgi:hypothetical protein